MNEPKTIEEFLQRIEFLRLGIENAKLHKKSEKLKHKNSTLKKLIYKYESLVEVMVNNEEE